MSSNESLPALSLSDIMHPMSPSPTPGEDQLPTASEETNNSNTMQEPLSDADVLNFRNRLQELGLVASYTSENEDLPIPRLSVENHLNQREKELTDMVLRLTSCPRVSPVQLEEQASIISNLTTQRDYLVNEAEEERLKIQSERENWIRTAEALLTQKTRPPKTEDADAQRVVYEAEIKSLREKLHDRHRRLSALEQEVLRLKPLLLLQPYLSQPIQQTQVTQNQVMKTPDKGKRRELDGPPSNLSFNVISPQKFDPNAYPYGYQYKPDVPIPSTQTNSHTFLLEGPPADSGSQRRRSKDQSNTQKSKKHKNVRSSIMTSDAYTELIFLATQKIGRKRAALVAGLQRLANREKEALFRDHEQSQSRKEQERLEKERLDRLASGTPSMTYYRQSQNSSPQKDDVSTPTAARTPKRGYQFTRHRGGNVNDLNTPSPSTFVFVNTPVSRRSKLPFNSNTPTPSDITPSNMRFTHLSNPPTPLDSLVDAARMMGESGERSNVGRRLPDEPESPTTKRRKVSTDKVLVHRGASKITRVKSGLDVLADQAVAVNKPGQISTPHSDTLTIRDRKGKGKVNAHHGDMEWSEPPKLSGNTRTMRSSSRKLFHSHDNPLSTPSSTTEVRTQGRTVTPEPRVIARPTVTSSFDSSGVSRVGLSLRPVTGWGDRPEEDSNSDSTQDSPTRSGLRNEHISSTRDPSVTPFLLEKEQVLTAPMTSGETRDNSNLDPKNGYDNERSTWTRSPTHPHIADDSRDAAQQALPHSSTPRLLTPGIPEVSPSPTAMAPLGSQLPCRETFQPAPISSAPSDHEHDIDAAGSNEGEDEDAEGEEDEENTDNDAEVAPKYHPSRSRSPPPPDPPGDDRPGSSGEQDPDMGADGDMNVEDKGTSPAGSGSTSHLSQSGQTVAFVMEKLSVPVSIEPTCIVACSKRFCVVHSILSIRAIMYNFSSCDTPLTEQFHQDWTSWNVMTISVTRKLGNPALFKFPAENYFPTNEMARRCTCSFKS